MEGIKYLKTLVEDIHSVTVATIGSDGHPVTRIIDMMFYDEEGIYFLTAKGKEFYRQLMEQQFIAISAVKNKMSVSLRGRIRNIDSCHLDEMFEKNPYMKGIYPGDTRSALEVFCLYEAQGEFFDISNPSCVTRADISIGSCRTVTGGYEITAACISCGICLTNCPQKCIDLTRTPAVIDQSHCLHCGSCQEKCPVKAVRKR